MGEISSLASQGFQPQQTLTFFDFKVADYVSFPSKIAEFITIFSPEPYKTLTTFFYQRWESLTNQIINAPPPTGY